MKGKSKKIRLLSISLMTIALASLIYAHSPAIKHDRYQIIYGTVTDIDGNVYKTVQLGKQTWIAENLRVTRLNDGTRIAHDTAWNNPIIPSYCWFHNNPADTAGFGGILYNYAAVATGKLCPKGWHVPSVDEWEQLVAWVGTQVGKGVEGTALKSRRGWAESGNGTDQFGFAVYPGGYRFYNGPFSTIGTDGSWWHSNDRNADSAYYRGLDYNKTDIYYSWVQKNFGLNVRCVKD